LSGHGIADAGRLADGRIPPLNGVVMVSQWLNSPVVWMLIVLIVSGLGIYRELF
jgi:hypothetical protein